MLLKIALTCTVCFVFSLIALLPYKECQKLGRPFLIELSVVVTAMLTFASWLVFCIVSIWWLI